MRRTLNEFIQDVPVRKAPGVHADGCCTLALGIGENAAIFPLVHAVDRPKTMTARSLPMTSMKWLDRTLQFLREQ